ncbi:MAG: ATP-binding protein [Mesorhizobium sp.]|nr:MAG: ATP-binding protein [Mesorhizobium sp.]
MYVTTDAVLKAITILRANVHPFVGITFVACKRFKLSVGSLDEVSLDTLTRTHMDAHHKIDRRSAHYFQPFKGSASWWVADRYPSSGLQTVNTQTFLPAFLHPRNQPRWGFASDYVERIQAILEEKNSPSLIPADALAIWLFKDEDIGDTSSYEDLVERFFTDYNISDEEQRLLFPTRAMPEQLAFSSAFSSEPLEMTSVTRELPEPPDATAEGGRTITSLHLSDAGPARDMQLDYGQRLTVVTGDNGLGKSFLLDFTWWAATGLWAEREALPSVESAKSPQVSYSLSSLSGRVRTFAARFDRKTFTWIRPKESMTIEALAVFSRADGSFAVADPFRARLNRTTPLLGSLSAFEVWNGKLGTIEGLIRDWVRWQTAPDSKAFDQFASVLKRLSPEDLGVLTPGPAVRLPGDARDIPTIQHRYGSVPVTHASAGVQRVLLLAYLIIWSWQEHELAARQLGQSPLRRMMVIVDELEAHLHPKWQRIVLPALMKVGDLLSSDLAIQMVAATHSPMILASLESTFDPSIDLLYHLYGDGPEIKLEETAFVKYGDASGWLTSPLFGLRHARSREAEMAIEAAKSLQLMDEPAKEEVEAVSKRLRENLAGDDKFWPRWLYFAESHGVAI